MRSMLSAFSFLLLAFSAVAQQSHQAVQFDINKTLNARPVTTLSHGKLVTWVIGIDGNGLGDGYLTLSAALFNGDKDPRALPDDATFAANASHPLVILHYSSDDTLRMQACALSGEGEITFAVKKGKYRDIYLALTSAEGPSALKIKFTYVDGMDEKEFTLPDYYNDISPADPNVCYLAHDLAKWGNKNNMTEKDHHNIDLLNIHPNPAKKLKSISITKGRPGYLVFWAATGVMAK